MALRASLSWLVPYAISVVFTKGLSLLTIPLVTRHLDPAEYGSLELVASLIEVAAIVLSFSVAEVLFRLAAHGDEGAARRAAAAIAGGAIVLALTVGGALQALLWSTDLLPAGFDKRLVAIGLLSASVSALIELPLAWLRNRARPSRFLLFTGARSVLQVGLMAYTLSQGYGALGILAGNCVVDCAVASVLLVRQTRDTGVRFDGPIFARAVRYGAPLVGSALSMFVLGACDRWFLVGVVTPGEIAHYALAAKLAMIVALAVQPFGLWWYARRLSVLAEPQGLLRSADAVAAGWTLLACGAVAVAVAAPMAIHFALPEAYAPAARYVPALVAIVALNEACSLLNAGSYCGARATAPLIVNTLGAVTALAGYVWLAPAYGIQGAIMATLAGHAVRIVCFLFAGRSTAPIPYRWGLMAAQCAIAAGAMALAQDQPAVRGALVGTLAIACVAALAARALWKRPAADACAPDSLATLGSGAISR